MNRYLIESPYVLEDWARLLQQLETMGYLYHFDWGSEAGIHCSWAIIEAESEEEARLAVPPLVRTKASVIKLTRFDAGQGKPLHKTQEKSNG